MFKKLRAQSTLEWTALMIIILSVFLAGQSYFKRGLQGRWRASVDGLGDQYDPLLTNGDVTTTLVQNSTTRVIAIDAPGGIWTERVDQSNSVEGRTGFTRVGAF